MKSSLWFSGFLGRSIWRSKRRTWITLSAIAFGLALAVFFISFADGVYNQMIDDATRMQGGHFTLEHPSYREAPAIDLFVTGVAEHRSRIESLDGVAGTKALILGQGVVRTGSGAVGVAVMGVEPSVEVATSPLAGSISSGSFLEDRDLRKVVIGVKLAERLNLKVGKKLVLTTNNADGDIVEELFRVKGTFEVGADEVDTLHGPDSAPICAAGSTDWAMTTPPSWGCCSKMRTTGPRCWRR